MNFEEIPQEEKEKEAEVIAKTFGVGKEAELEQKVAEVYPKSEFDPSSKYFLNQIYQEASKLSPEDYQTFKKIVSKTINNLENNYPKQNDYSGLIQEYLANPKTRPTKEERDSIMKKGAKDLEQEELNRSGGVDPNEN